MKNKKKIMDLAHYFILALFIVFALIPLWKKIEIFLMYSVLIWGLIIPYYVLSLYIVDKILHFIIDHV